MATVTRAALSGSTNGKAIKVTGAVTTIHTSVSGTSDWDEIWLWASAPLVAGDQRAGCRLELRYPGASGTWEPRLHLDLSSGPVLICPGWIANDEKQVKVKVLGDFVALITGYVNRITV
jgi:hypothetical protein